ncbi:hypothetical protein D4R20_03415, partial [bacterium]
GIALIKKCIEKLAETAQNENLAKADRLKVIGKLWEISLRYFGDLSLKKTTIKEFTIAINKYIDFLLTKTKAGITLKEAVKLTAQNKYLAKADQFKPNQDN